MFDRRADVRSQKQKPSLVSETAQARYFLDRLAQITKYRAYHARQTASTASTASSANRLSTLHKVTKCRACHARQPRRQRRQASRSTKSPSAAPATRDSRGVNGVKRQEALQRVVKTSRSKPILQHATIFGGLNLRLPAILFSPGYQGPD